jgi:cytochrome c oxidase subunit II
VRWAGAALAGALAVCSLSLVPVAGADPPVIEILASHQGFQPSTVNLRRGEPVRIVLSTADDVHCFAVDAFRLEKRIAPGRKTAFDFTPDRAGSFPFYCCLESGRAVVIERGRLEIEE